MTLSMSMFRWLSDKKLGKPTKPGKARKPDPSRARRSFEPTIPPVMSPRRRRRTLRREQLFTVVRESMIRGGVLSTSYEFKVLTLDADGDHFLVLIDLALPAQSMPDEYLMEIERWIQNSAQSRHEMGVRSVYWRRKSAVDQRGMALKAAAAVQTGRQSPGMDGAASLPVQQRRRIEPVQAVSGDEIEAFRRALLEAAPIPVAAPSSVDVLLPVPVPESHSDFSALSETQHGKL
jgi:hypothetical protein